MKRIEYILNLINWNNSRAGQDEGIRLAREEKDVRPFLQPCTQEHNKNVWDNCAVILSERSDEELSPYLIELLEWLQDLNWPGALCILDRMRRYSDKDTFDAAFHLCMKRAQERGDEVWRMNLQRIKRQTACISAYQICDGHDN